MLNFAAHIVSLDHTAVGVAQLENAIPLFRDMLGGVSLGGGQTAEQNFQTASFVYPNGSKIEIIAPLAGGDGFMRKFLSERGPGAHHLTFIVKDIQRLATQLKAQGYRVVGENYQHTGWRELFISPLSAHGTIVQLAETDRAERGQKAVANGSAVEFDHTALCVPRIDDALPLWRDLLGGTYVMAAELPDKGFRFAQYAYPNGGKIEILEPLGEHSFLHKFLQARGPGIHHLTFKVKEIEAHVAQLKAKGYAIVGENYCDPTWKEAFIAPASANGTVVQLAEAAVGDGVAPPPSAEFERRMRGQ